uniref:Sec-independent protein translocase protein TATA, chloroplastic n=1 Tax=Glycine max TaxID=3847 RepID=C6T1N3_SOYBN|nr:unknown [Glycine max]
MDLTLSLSPSSSSLVTSRLGYSSSLATNSNANSRKARISTRRSKALTCNALFGLGLPELAVIAGVAALAFGPKNLPQVGRSLGKTIKSFQQAAKEFESEIKKEPDSTEENPTAAEKPIAASKQEEQETKCLLKIMYEM